MTPELEFVPSMHEQREFNEKIIPEEGWWVEVGKFTPLVESFDIKERYVCIEKTEQIDPVKDIKGFKIVLKKIPIDTTKTEEIVNKVLEKHGDLLAASLLKCVVKGARLSKSDIARFKNRVIANGDKVLFNKLEDERERDKIIEYSKKKISATESKLEKYKKELLDLENGVIPNGKEDNK